MAARLSELPFPEKSLHTLYIPAYFNRWRAKTDYIAIV
jgi:hypothetical protein